MKFGTYRIYFKLPLTSIGIKLPRYNFTYINSFAAFLTGIIMNILERKRYKRYVLGKKYGYEWEPNKYSLCPTYFSLCGLINIVAHTDVLTEVQPKWKYKGYNPSPFTENPDKLNSFGLLNDNIVEIDYGDFTIYSYKANSVGELDYK